MQRLPSGRYRVRVPTGDGRRIGGTYDTEAEAEVARGSLVAELVRRDRAPTGSTTLGAWVARWLDERERDGYRGTREERSVHRNRIAPHPLAAVPLADVTRAAVRAWLTDQARSTVQRRTKTGRAYDTGRPLGATTLARFRAVLHSALADAVDGGLIASNPASGIKLAGVERGKRRRSAWTYLTREEIAAVLGCDEIPPRFRLVYQVAIYTGLRRGELWGLRWADVALEGERPELHVQRSYNEPTKTGADRRVPLLAPARAALQRLWLMAGRPGPDRLVFPTAKGHMRNECDRAQWQPNGGGRGYRAVAGIARNVPFHAFRHTCATALVSGFWGTPWRLEDVSRFLGHSSLAVTQRYAHLSPDWLHTRAADTARVPPADAVGTRREVTVRNDYDTRSSTTNGGSGETNRLSAERVLSLSRALASALLQGVELGLPTRDTTAALIASVQSLGDHPLVALATAVEQAGVHRVRRAIDLADAVLAIDLADATALAPGGTS